MADLPFRDIRLKESPSTDEELTVKWKVFVTFASDSRTIRNSFISEWNKHASHIFVAKSNKNNELLCQFLLPRKIHVDAIYDRAWIAAKTAPGTDLTRPGRYRSRY